MALSGMVTDLITRSPLDDVRIELSVSGERIAALVSDKNGRFEYGLGKVSVGQRLSWAAQRADYERQEGEVQVGNEDVELNINLKSIQKEKEERQRVEVEISTVDERGSLLKGAMVTIKLEGKELERETTDSFGKAAFSLSPEIINKKISYDAKLDGYVLGTGECELKAENVEEVRLKKMEKKRWSKWLLAGSSLGVFGLVVALWLWPDPPEDNGDKKKPVSIAMFEASKTSVERGDQVTLSWRIKNANRVTLNGEQVRSVDRETDRPNVTTTYRLVAMQGDKTDEKTVSVKVFVHLPDVLGYQAIDAKRKIERIGFRTEDIVSPVPPNVRRWGPGKVYKTNPPPDTKIVLSPGTTVTIYAQPTTPTARPAAPPTPTTARPATPPPPTARPGTPPPPTARPGTPPPSGSQ